MKRSATDVLDQNPGARAALAMLADQWTVLTIYRLGRNTLRYSELQRAIPEISPKMLTQTLRHLERNGILARKVYPVVPPRTEYCLTRMGLSLLQPLHALCLWSESHASDVTKARAQFERRYSKDDSPK